MYLKVFKKESVTVVIIFSLFAPFLSVEDI